MWLQRYGEKNFRDLFVISGKWLGLNWEIFSNSKSCDWKKMVGCGIIMDKDRGLIVIVAEIFWFWNYF
jgi:hypothetical protein